MSMVVFGLVWVVVSCFAAFGVAAFMRAGSGSRTAPTRAEPPLRTTGHRVRSPRHV
jgi:hypothetical protein